MRSIYSARRRISVIKNRQVSARSPLRRCLHLSCGEYLTLHCHQDESVQKYRHMYFRSGWVNNAAVWEVKNKKFFIIKTMVNHSYSLNDPPLTAWVAVEKEGLVRFDHCTCMAGLGECCVIERETRLQSKYAMWFDQKAGRVTASNIRAACHTNTDKPAVSLLKKLCYPVAYKNPNNNTPQSLRWGTEHESKVVEEYIKMMENNHTNLTVRKGGLVISPQYPWLGASPDGIISCDCHEMGVLEVKAPSSLQNSTLIEKSKEESAFCLQEVGGKLSLKKDHQYFYQVQTQIHLTQAIYCDFVIGDQGKMAKEKSTLREFCLILTFLTPCVKRYTHLSRNA